MKRSSFERQGRDMDGQESRIGMAVDLREEHEHEHKIDRTHKRRHEVWERI